MKFLKNFLGVRTLSYAMCALSLQHVVVFGAEVRAQEVSFANAGRMVTALRYASSDKGVRPTILLLHGASGYAAFRTSYERYAKTLTEHGYNVYAVMYYDEQDERMLNGKISTQANRDKAYRERVPNWVDTVRAAIGFVATQADTDPRRIGLVGFSGGGFVAVGTAGLDERIGAVVVIYGGMPSALSEKIKRLPPTLILHGDADTVVPVAQARTLERFLREHSVEHMIKIYPGVQHGFALQADTPFARDAQQRTLEFFDARLVDAAR